VNPDRDENRPAVAVLTPPGRGAVATVAVWGAGATDAVGALFSPASGRALSLAAVGRVVFGHWGSSAGEELVVCRRADDEIEIHCHGGEAAARLIVDSLVERACRPVGWTSWIRRQASDPFAVEALEVLARSTTLRCAALLLDQYRGALGKELELCLRLLESADEASLDAARIRLQSLADRSLVGRHLVEPFHVVIAGQPNVGKSSLLNTLAGYQRSIVFDQPGTTRDVVTVRTAIDGWPVELSDTAGLRSSGDRLESAGVQLSLARMKAADLVILVFDASQPWQDSHNHLAEKWPDAVVVSNKADLILPPLPDRQGLFTSATARTGIDEIVNVVAGRLVPDPPPAGAAVPFLARHERAIREVLALLDSSGSRAAQLLSEFLMTDTDPA
jgi:tRNA modification GTPase